ncbi:MAG: DNA repair protein RecO [Bacteroidales bacterium]|nr:DNA repair protein RecO [Bacteroidales bacterium]
MIVLHTTKYSENSLIIHGYTLEKGRVGVILKGAVPGGGRRRTTKGKAISVLHPLSIMDIQTVENHKGGMETLREYNQRYQLNSIRSDITKSSMAMFLGELMYRTLVTSEEDQAMYRFIENAILLLDRLEGSAANFHIWFIICYCQMLGFAPVEGFGVEFDPFSVEEKEILNKIYNASFEDAMMLPLSGSLRRKLIDSLIKYMEYHTGSRIQINSLAVLQTIFSV